MSRVIVLSVGHTGSRIIGQVLKRSGYKTGKVNNSFDTVEFSGAVRDHALHLAKCSAYSQGRWSWDPPPRPAGYLEDAPEAFKQGWPSLCMPWLIDAHPDTRYIRWFRDPRDTVLWSDAGVKMFVNHGIPGFEGLEYQEAAGQFIRYWWQLQITFKPKFVLQMKYEDYCNDPESQIHILSEYLGRRMATVPAHDKRIGRWRREADPPAESVLRAAKELYYANVPHRVHTNV